MMLYSDVQDGLAEGPETVLPDPDDVDGIAEFCSGYLRGARMHAAWLNDQPAVVLLFVIAAIAGEVDKDDLRDTNNEPLADPEEWLHSHRERLADYLAELYEYWASKRKLAAARKVGRNDPCPCGSGKKHKKCCLA
jgi:uncharacterized protein